MNFGDPFAPVYVVPLCLAGGVLLFFLISGKGHKQARRADINYFPERED